ncbi:O-antigen ligase family protein [Nisaea acidiphila]|uniref:O-antigen ligase family protein n=1 Tax=Nisaea acidiphila TaxID=1862145 RepID=A0A9J7ASS2_9PROT|nr:O-antigen ligase family protein [Nisaea acidiphila]UUX49545.1 O-antigen ligase family protein [Nisaea acidiphila]
MTVSESAADPRFARFRFWLLALLLLLFVPVGILAKQAMATFFIAGAILLLGAVALERRRLPLPERPVLIAFAAVVLLSLLGPLAGGFPLDIARTAPKLGLLALLLLAISAAPDIAEGLARRKLAHILALSLCLGALIFAIEIHFDAPLYRFFSGKGDAVDVAPSRFNRGSTALVLLTWPAAAALWLHGRRIFPAVILLLGLAAAFTGESASAALAAVVALLLLPLGLLLPRFTAAAIFVCSTLLMLAAPWIFAHVLTLVPDYLRLLPPSFAERLEIWNAASLAVLERPWLGQGLGAMRSLAVPEALRESYALFKTSTIHPHNAAVQIWLDFGLFGILAALALLWNLIQAAGRSATVARAAALSALGAGLVIASVSYGLWQETWLGLIGFTILTFGVLCRDDSASD